MYVAPKLDPFHKEVFKSYFSYKHIYIYIAMAEIKTRTRAKGKIISDVPTKLTAKKCY